MGNESKRIYELAKEYNISSNAMLKIIRDLKFDPKSHMSVATPEMTTAVANKFTEEKKEAKKEMERRAQVSKAVAKKAETKKPEAPKKASPPVSRSSLTGLVRKFGNQPRRPDRKKRRDRRTVNKEDVAKSFKATMATMTTSRTRKKYHRDTDTTDVADTGAQNTIEVNEYPSIAELAKMMDRRPAEVIAKLFEMGMMATINQRLDMDTVEMVASEFGFEVTKLAEVGDAVREREDEKRLESRPPIVTIMGHVDHGKTSLLDYIRKSDVVSGEAGAITQHIGAYEVEHDGGKITFLDTPGHEAFTAMRARGSQVTDIVILVVAADDGIRPQTIEAIDHARAADVPIITAISKIDKPEANLDNVRAQLAERSIVSEEWGGQNIVVNISSKTGEGIDKLMEMILLQAEMMDLKADPYIKAQGVIIDSRLEKGRGPVATVLIRTGCCQIGDIMVAGTFSGRIRTISDDRNKPLTKIGPSVPAQLAGLNGVPQAGNSFMTVNSDSEAREICMRREQVRREQESRRPRGAVTLDRVFDRIKEGQIKEVRLIIKADVDGSAEVLTDTLGDLGTDEVRTAIIHKGVGAITESDVLLASASEAIIIGFQVGIDTRAREAARKEKIDIRMYDVIYDAQNDVRKALEGLLSPEISESFTGSAEVRDLFKVPKVGTIAGSYVREGTISRKDKVRLVREGKVIYTGALTSLKRFKDDAKEVKEGFECGIGLENFDDIKVGDIIEAFELIETARTLST